MENEARICKLKSTAEISALPEEITKAEELYLVSPVVDGKVFISTKPDPVGQVVTLVWEDDVEYEKKSMTSEELKEMIIDLKLQMLKLNMPRNLCPYLKYEDQRPKDCNSRICAKCYEQFTEQMRQEIRKEVESL